MNHTDKCKLLVYLDTPWNKLDQAELEDYDWLLEQQLQAVRTAKVIRPDARIDNAPARP